MPENNLNETYIDEIFEKTGCDRNLYTANVDDHGRITVTNKVTNRKTVVGILLPDKGVYITKTASKSTYQYDRKCINFYVDKDTYDMIVKKAILTGDNLSQFCRKAVVAKANKIDFPEE